MNRIALSLLVASALLCSASEHGSAQTADEHRELTRTPHYAHPIGIHVRANADASDTHRLAARSDEKVEQGPRVSIYILGGIAIGALAGGAFAAVTLSHSQECICPLPVLVGMSVGGGSVAGGLLGLLVYGIRKSIWDDDHSHP